MPVLRQQILELLLSQKELKHQKLQKVSIFILYRYKVLFLLPFQKNRFTPIPYVEIVCHSETQLPHS